MSNIAIIPARGGSKRVPLKNIRVFEGTPMIIRTIHSIKRAKCFDKIIVSTDSELIADCVSTEKEVHISWREPELANDKTNTVDVIANEILRNNISTDAAVCCIYAPNPFLHHDALRLGLNALEVPPTPKFVSSVTTFPFPIQRSLKFTENSDLLEMAQPEFILTHSQNLIPRFHETAQFWWARGITWLAKEPMQVGVRGIYIPRWMSQDIDNLEDWHFAEIRWRVLQQSDEFKKYVFNEKNIVNQDNFSE